MERKISVWREVGEAEALVPQTKYRIENKRTNGAGERTGQKWTADP